jgi:hypothetical protein
MCADAHGNPIDFEITGVAIPRLQTCPQFITLVDEAEHFTADKGYDSDEIPDKTR